MLSFLVVMPFSYLPWEKYALPLLVLCGVALCTDPAEDRR